MLPTFTRGRAIVGVCGAPFKCPPAPSEAALLLHDYLSERGIRGDCEISLVSERHPATVEQPADGITTRGTSATVRLGRAPEDGISHELDGNELGLKDTVRVSPNGVVDIVVRFEVFCGRYMYHCYILEHEDHDMMRPFVVMPAELMPFMDSARATARCRTGRRLIGSNKGESFALVH